MRLSTPGVDSSLAVSSKPGNMRLAGPSANGYAALSSYGLAAGLGRPGHERVHVEACRSTRPDTLRKQGLCTQLRKSV